MQESKQGGTHIVSLVKNVSKSTKCIKSLRFVLLISSVCPGVDGMCFLSEIISILSDL